MYREFMRASSQATIGTPAYSACKHSSDDEGRYRQFRTQAVGGYRNFQHVSRQACSGDNRDGRATWTRRQARLVLST